MERASAAAAAEIAFRAREKLAGGVRVFAGPGNNGGDAWVVARALATSGVHVTVVEALAAKTADAIAERSLAQPYVVIEDAAHLANAYGEAIVVDGLLGTGSTGLPRGAIADGVSAINGARARGAFVVALDLPTGVDATTGTATGAVLADLTITFGTVKRGHLVARQACGAIVVVDIGLGEFATRNDGALPIVDTAWVARGIPPISADAHKGVRKKLAVIGGATGMAGASILAARAAMRSGVGMVRVIVSPDSLPVVQAAEPLALAAPWPADDSALDREIISWADGVVIGPGLGRSSDSRVLVDRVLARFGGPVLLDADALNVFDGDVDALRRALNGRPALLTPHPAEFARLARTTVDEVLNRRFEIGADLAKRTGATVLLKGVPTVITAPGGSALVSAAGTPILAAAGSGDILSGIAGTLLAQTSDALRSGAIAAWIHGHAAEIVQQSAVRPRPGAALEPHTVRGHTLHDVLDAIALGWPSATPVARYPVLFELPAVGERG